MTQEEARLLKQKFYDATATPDEERQLAQLLRSKDCPQEWAEERRALLALLPEKETALPEGFGLRLAQRLEKEIAATQPSPQHWWIRWSAAAAIIIIVGGTTLWFFRTPPTEEPAPTPLMTKVEIPVAPTPVIAKAEKPEMVKEPPVAPTPRQKNKRRQRRKTTTAAPATEATQLTPTAAEERTLQPEPTPRPTAEPSLAEHLQRTQQSRDRLIAEARNFMSGSSLDRRISLSN